MARDRDPSQPLERAAEMHRASFDEEPEVLAFAPGRVELLGNHTDYNQGLALAAALPLGTAVAASTSTDGRCCAVAADLSAEAHFTFWDDRREPDSLWANYIKGMAVELMTRYGPQVRGFHATIAGNLPRGAGLSSSASVEVASGLALCKLYGWPEERSEIALAGRRAEEHYAGVRCGLLDQLTSLHGLAGHAVLIDFRSLQVDRVAVPGGTRLVLVNTGVQRENAASDYNARREACETAARLLGEALQRPVTSLRDVAPAEFAAHADKLPPDVASRAEHVLGENERVAAGAEFLRDGKVAEFGRLMAASHQSSRVLFENSCEELDALVDEALKLDGVHGARLSGGGFGGSVVALVDAAAAGDAARRLKEVFQERFLRDAEVLVTSPAPGARLVDRRGAP